MSSLRVVTEELGGSSLASAGMAGRHPEWFAARPAGVAEWAERVALIQREARADWAGSLAPALAADGTVPHRLRDVVAQRGVVVTTGQQPGLFGGPLYTLSKAIAALELADALQAATGVPVAPVFWAATDDADFAEATSVWVRGPQGALRVSHAQEQTDGIPMAAVPISGLTGAWAALEAASGSAADSGVLALAREWYREGMTIGDAYVGLLRGLLEPLGIAVLDASHPSMARASRPILEAALRSADQVGTAVANRDASIVQGGYEPQVAGLAGQSLVFTRVEGRKVRVPISESLAAALDPASALSPNVLLRPVAERQLLPTVAYVAGPGEFAYFAQVSAVAGALGVAAPLAVPRWSCTVLEASIQRNLERHGIAWRTLQDPHASEREVARQRTAPAPLAALGAMREAVLRAAEAFKDAVSGTGAPLDVRVVDGTVRAMTWRVDRLERRLLAGIKRREAVAMSHLAQARAALFPAGGRQERALSFLPMLAMHGTTLLDAMRAAAATHASSLLHGTALPHDP